MKLLDASGSGVATDAKPSDTDLAFDLIPKFSCLTLA
jgi:hypothetical protein